MSRVPSLREEDLRAHRESLDNKIVRMKGKLCRIRDIQRGSPEDDVRTMVNGIVMKRKLPIIVRILDEGEVVSLYHFEGTGVGKGSGDIRSTTQSDLCSGKYAMKVLHENGI